MSIVVSGKHVPEIVALVRGLLKRFLAFYY